MSNLKETRNRKTFCHIGHEDNMLILMTNTLIVILRASWPTVTKTDEKKARMKEKKRIEDVEKKIRYNLNNLTKTRTRVIPMFGVVTTCIGHKRITLSSKQNTAKDKSMIPSNKQTRVLPCF